MLEIKQMGYPTLTQKAEKVTDFKDPAFQKLVEDMVATLKGGSKNGVGLAANQVGELKSVCICRRLDLENASDDEEFEPVYEVLVNPVIVNKSEAMSTYWEGCFSIRKGDLFGQVTRPKKVKVRYQNEKGEKRDLVAKSFFSHVVQHEIDHLNGVLFTSYVSDPEELYTWKELDEMKNNSD